MQPTLSRLLATALAEMCTVPNSEIMLTTSTRPSWNRLFSSAEGMPMYRILRIMAGRGRHTAPQVTRAGLSCRVVVARMSTAPTMRETSVGTATPATPILSTKTQKALPQTLMMFISTLTRMDTALLPTDRKMAAPALYSARNG